MTENNAKNPTITTLQPSPNLPTPRHRFCVAPMLDGIVDAFMSI